MYCESANLNFEVQDRDGIATHDCSSGVTVFIKDRRYSSRVELDTQPLRLALFKGREERMIGASIPISS